ncbi:hypothetical protein BC628DRAFT_1367779 [Trametes gibbosa]|nr:hypothetical protein BC628DRAFT_1367779 [Trametes gibbosa]
MADLGTDPILAAEFVKFLNAQLQMLKRENDSLKQRVETLISHNGDVDTPDKYQQTISSLHESIDTLKRELNEARCSAEAHRREAGLWQGYYDKLKTSYVPENLGELQRKATVDKVIRLLKKDLAKHNASNSSETPLSSHTTQTYEEFQKFMLKLSASTAAEMYTGESRIVFDQPQLQILPKAAIAACDGGFAFFGSLVRWCPAPCQNGLLICPTLQYTPQSGTGVDTISASWSHPTEWSSLVGQRRELLDTDGEHLTYAGTFLIHAGPKLLQLTDLPDPSDKGLVHELAHRTFDPSSKSQRVKSKPYLLALGAMYKSTDGALPVSVLGLQRVGFNERFFAVLRKAYGKRGKASEKARAWARSETQRSMSPHDLGLDDDVVVSKKHAREEHEEEEMGTRPSKFPKLGCGLLDDF